MPELSPVGSLAQAGDPDRFTAALFAPAPVREGLFAIIALNVEVAKIAVTVSEPLLGEIRLQWWLDAVEELCDHGTRRPHDILAALPRLNKEVLIGIIAARRFDIYEEPMTNRSALDEYLAATGGGVARAMAEAAGAPAEALEIAGGIGWSEAAGRLIEALPRLYHEGISPIPTAEKLDLNAVAEGKTPEPLRVAVAEIASDALHRLNALRRRKLSADARAACLSAHIYEPTLKRATAPGFDVFSPPDRPSPFRAKATMLWRGATGRV